MCVYLHLHAVSMNTMFLTTSRGGLADLLTICPQSVLGAFRLVSYFHVIKDNPSAVQSNFNVMC